MNKKNRIKLFLGLVFCLTLMSFNVYHKFYVSVTQIDYNEGKKRIEISNRIFVDDLEKALEEIHHQKLYLGTPKENATAKKWVVEYIQQNFNVKVNGKPKEVIFLGTEYEDNLIICYFKVDYSKKIGTFEIYNNFLTAYFSEQQNIIHTNINNEKRSFLLTEEQKTTTIEYH